MTQLFWYQAIILLMNLCVEVLSVAQTIVVQRAAPSRMQQLFQIEAK